MKLLLLMIAATVILGSGCKTLPPPPPFDPKVLEVADYLCYAPEKFSDDPFGALIGDNIASITHRLKSHVEVVYSITNGEVITLGARAEGINFYPVRIDYCLACVRRCPMMARFDKEAADAAVSEDIGKPYDTAGLFSFLLAPFIMPSRFVRVCSTETVKYLRAGGLEPVNRYVLTSTVTPADLFVTGGAVTIWRQPSIDRVRYPVRITKEQK